MSGPLQRVKTQIAAVALDVNRQLNLGPNCALVFLAEDATQVGGVREIKRITAGFNRVPRDEATTATGQEVAYHVADLAGDLAQTIRDARLVQLIENGVSGPRLFLNDAPKPPEGRAQVYVLICNVRKLKRTYQ